MILTSDDYINEPSLVLACGCFDVITWSHVRHLKAASKLGHVLGVLITADRFINKPNRPVFPEALRAEVIDSLRCVNYAILNQHSTAVEAIQFYRPKAYVKGSEYRDQPTMQLCAERDAVESVGGRLVFIDGEESHTTDVLRRLEP